MYVYTTRKKLLTLNSRGLGIRKAREVNTTMLGKHTLEVGTFIVLINHG